MLNSIKKALIDALKSFIVLLDFFYLKVKFVKSTVELNQFKEAYHLIGDAPVTTEYLQNARVVVMYLNREGVIVAQYVVSVNNLSKTRYVSDLNLSLKDRNEMLAKVNLGHDPIVAEIACIAIQKTVSVILKLFIFLSSIFDAMHQKDAVYIIGGCLFGHFQRQISSVIPYLLYSGEVAIKGKIWIGKVYYCPNKLILRLTLVLAIFSRIWYECKKLFL
jgi:hypothetical protein